MDNSYDAPKSNLEESDPLGFTKDAKRPWAVYAVAISFFFFVLGYLISFARVLGQSNNDPQLTSTIAVISMIVGFAIIIGIVRLSFWLSLSSAVVAFLTIALNLIDIATMLTSTGLNYALLAFKLIYVVFPLFGAIYVCRRKHRELMLAYAKSKEYKHRQKQAFKR